MACGFSLGECLSPKSLAIIWSIREKLPAERVQFAPFPTRRELFVVESAIDRRIARAGPEYVARELIPLIDISRPSAAPQWGHHMNSE